MKAEADTSQVGIEGTLMVLSPLLLLVPFLTLKPECSFSWRLAISFFLLASSWGSAFTLFRYPRLGKVLACGTIVIGYATAFQYIFADPFTSLAGLTGLIGIIFLLFDSPVPEARPKEHHAERCLLRARWSALTVLGLSFIYPFLPLNWLGLLAYALAAAAIIGIFLFLHWATTVRSFQNCILAVSGMVAVICAFILFPDKYFAVTVAAASIVHLIALPRAHIPFAREEQWWEVLLSHPARILCITFFFLCASGTLLLILPISTRNGTIDLVDAAFTSVSAVCVTGLTVVDTAQYFSLFGKCCIMLLIQLGGLGIMSITTVALHIIGKRLSLKHERLLTSIADTSHRDLVDSLTTILKFTFVTEGIGAALLASYFFTAGEPLVPAIWRGTFTSISAFCNAGFALQSDNLIPYQCSPLVLNVVAILIICGGIAPATSLLIPRWITGKKIPIAAQISLITTAILLCAGTFCILAFEWEGVLNGLSVPGKIQNAWFQSVTLRTAGFNSVDLTHISSPTFLVMLAFMFVGGSPGGTAGGVKTTTLGILILTFLANIASRNEVIVQHKRIHPGTIYRAVTVVISGSVLWFFVVLMLEVTQRISSKQLIFEATSAIGTVGLSIGATPLLDEIGKVIIIIAMFAGRIGPVTLFMLLSEQQRISDARYPVETVSIT